MKNGEDVVIVHRTPEYDTGEHINSTKCECLPVAEIGDKGQIIITHRHFRLELSRKVELEEIWDN